MIFKHPGFLWLFLLYIPLIAWYILKHRNASPSLSISSLRAFAKTPVTWKVWMMHGEFVLRLIAIGAIIVALCRPQTFDSFRNSQIEGTDIAIALDISGSMTASDLRPNRLAAAKDVATKFVNSRSDDNMALVVFAGESLSLMPLTNDRAALVNSIKRIDMGALTDGTAIGDGLTSAVNRLLSGNAKSKSIILLTDGTNNAGDVAPATAAEIARQNGIKVYTIGVGTNGSMTIPDPYGYSSTTIETKIDEAALKQIANETGGKYFRATNKGMLEQVFAEIDQLEKTRLDVERYTTADEDFMPWVLLAIAAFALELMLRYVVLRRIP